MASHINIHYSTTWNELEIISRFGLDQQAASVVKKFSLRILEVLDPSMRNDSIYGDFRLREYNLTLLQEYQTRVSELQNFFVPAGWAKDVMWALSNAGRRLVMDYDPVGKRKIVCVADENGQGIYYL